MGKKEFFMVADLEKHIFDTYKCHLCYNHKQDSFWFYEGARKRNLIGYVTYYKSFVLEKVQD